MNGHFGPVHARNAADPCAALRCMDRHRHAVDSSKRLRGCIAYSVAPWSDSHESGVDPASSTGQPSSVSLDGAVPHRSRASPDCAMLLERDAGCSLISSRESAPHGDQRAGHKGGATKPTRRCDSVLAYVTSYQRHWDCGSSLSFAARVSSYSLVWRIQSQRYGVESAPSALRPADSRQIPNTSGSWIMTCWIDDLSGKTHDDETTHL